MSGENSPNLSRKTWAREIEPVTKIGYMDGAADGQASVYQKSFDVGYEQGFNFGFDLGYKEAPLRINQKRTTISNALVDPRKINCQMCINGINNQETISNLYNHQKEKNLEIIK